MQERTQAAESTRCNTAKPEENQASEPTIIAEQHRKPLANTGGHSSKSEFAASPVPPEKPSNPNPSQQSQPISATSISGRPNGSR